MFYFFQIYIYIFFFFSLLINPFNCEVLAAFLLAHFFHQNHFFHACLQIHLPSLKSFQHCISNSFHMPVHYKIADFPSLFFHCVNHIHISLLLSILRNLFTIPKGQILMDTIPNGNYPELTRFRTDTIPNVHDSKRKPSRMDTILNEHYPECTPSRMGACMYSYLGDLKVMLGENFL